MDSDLGDGAAEAKPAGLGDPIGLELARDVDGGSGVGVDDPGAEMFKIGEGTIGIHTRYGAIVGEDEVVPFTSGGSASGIVPTEVGIAPMSDGAPAAIGAIVKGKI